MTLKLWKETKKPNAKLIYISFESAPLTKIELNNVYKKVSGVKILFNQLIKKLPILYQSTHRIFFDSENVELILIYDDFNSLKNFKFKADVWCLDGFAPKKNKSAWNSKLFEQIYLSTKFKGTLSTFTSAGYVRRGLSNSGFFVSKVVGFGNKKESLIGIKKSVISKVDMVRASDIKKIQKLCGSIKTIEVAAPTGVGIEELKEQIYESLEFVSIYMKPQGEKADLEEPMVVRKGTTISEICQRLHRDFVRKFRYSQIWGPSAKFPGQTVGLNHKVLDGDIVSIITHR